MDIFKKSKKIAKETLEKATEVANDINEKIEKRKEIRNLLEKMADYEDEILMYFVTLNDAQIKTLPDAIKDNISAIKKIEEEIKLIQINDLPEEDEFEQCNYSSEAHFCTRCGKEVDPTDIYCRYCGTLR